MKRKIKCIGAVTMALVMAVTMLPTVSPKAASPGNYSFFDEYSIGWESGIRVYKDGKTMTVKDSGLQVYNVYEEADDPFVSETNQAWDEPNLVLTQPVSFTTKNGEVHQIENMLTSFDFIADPTAIDNSEVDGKLYVYGTTEGFSYGNMSRDNPTVTANPGEKLVGNKYQNHSLTILSTSDMVNWTDEGFMDSMNLTNLPSYEENNFEKCGWTNGPSWAPSGLKYDIDGTGNYKYYLFYTNGGNSGYVMSDSPTGPWEEPEKDAIFNKNLPNCSDCSVCFDPAVLMDENGEGYIYFGGLSRTSGRALRIKFDPETGRVSPDGDPVKLPTYAMFEDNEINKFNGKYYYSYCTDFSPQSLTKNASIAVYVSDDPLNVAFNVESRPKGEEFTAFKDDNGTYRHFLGTVLENPSSIFGEGYNNHHHMQEFKGHKYIFYHSTVLHNTLHRINNQYRNLHVDEIEVDEETDMITGKAVDENGKKTVSTYQGPEQIEAFNPYYNADKSIRIINATTSSNSAGVKSSRDDAMVLNSKNGSPMVLDSIETGDWTKIQGVDFGSEGAAKFSAELTSQTDQGAIEVFVDDPTNADNFVVSLPVKQTEEGVYDMLSTDISKAITGQHDVYFVFRGSDYKVASWKFDSADTDPKPSPSVQPSVQPSTQPSVQPSVQPSAEPAIDSAKSYKAGKVSYKVDADAASAKVVSVNKNAASVTIPATVTIEGKKINVTEIAPNAFKNCKKLKSVVIGKKVKTIGAKAFAGCNNLKKVTIKSTVLKKVGKNAFKGTSKKANIKVPKAKKKVYVKLLKGKGIKKIK